MGGHLTEKDCEEIGEGTARSLIKLQISLRDGLLRSKNYLNASSGRLNNLFTEYIGICSNYISSTTTKFKSNFWFSIS